MLFHFTISLNEYLHYFKQHIPIILSNKIFSCRVQTDANVPTKVQVDIQIKVVAKQPDMQQNGQRQEIQIQSKEYMPMHHMTMQQGHSNTDK